MVRHRTEQHIHVRVPLHRKLFPSFMSGWTQFKCILRRFVQIWFSIILMICRHSIECTQFRDFLLNYIIRGQIELKWVSDCQKASFSTGGCSLQEIEQDHSVTDHTCPVDARGSDGENHTGNSEVAKRRLS